MEPFDPLEVGDRIARNIMLPPERYACPATDPALEGLLYLYDASREERYLEYVLGVLAYREEHLNDASEHHISSTDLNFEAYLRTGSNKFISDFQEKAEGLYRNLPRDEDGAVCDHGEPGEKTISIDMLQAYAVMMARTGWLCGNPEYFGECANQYQICRNILRNQDTGLWHQESNYPGTPGVLSPGHWNRAQGWVLRGIVDSLDYLPANSLFFSIMTGLLEEFAGDLIPYQDIRGMWHQLTDHDEAYPETSGTALIVHYLYKAFHRGWLPRDPYLSKAEKALNALLGFVRGDGSIINASLGTKPLGNLEGYLHLPAVAGSPRAAGYLLMACAGPFLARTPRSMA